MILYTNSLQFQKVISNTENGGMLPKTFLTVSEGSMLHFFILKRLCYA